MNPASNLYQELEYAQLEAIIAHHIGNNAALLEYRLLKGGMFNTTYLLTLSNGHRLVLRVGPINRQLLLPFEENLMAGEDYVYRLCRPLGIPVSEVVACDTSKTIIDRDFMLVEYIDSIVLSSKDMPAAEKPAMHEKVGFYARQMHQITGPAFGRASQIVSNKGFAKWSDFIKAEVSACLEKLRGYPVYPEETLPRFFAVYEKNTQLLDTVTTPRLVHADLWDGNILISPQPPYSVAAIIDADRAVFGDILFEFASGWMINEAFIRGYGSPPSEDAGAKTRKMLYQLLYNLLDSYICLAQYNHAQNSDNNKRGALELLHLLEQ